MSLPDEAPGGGMINSVGPHRRMWEYDGAYKCLDCQAKWGVLDGQPSMPLICGARELGKGDGE